MGRRVLNLMTALTVAGLSLPLAAGESGDALIEATQREDLAAVKRLLAAGADVDARSRYGATPLFFACDKGNLELVRLLLERGAEVNVRDTFYNATPLAWSLFQSAESEPHRQIALLLLETGAEDAAAALTMGVQRGDLGLVEAALATGRVEPQEQVSALAAARAAGRQEIVDYLIELAPEVTTPEATTELSPEKLASYVGDYKNEDIGMTARVFVDGEDLKIQASGQQALVIVGSGEDVFEARDVPDIEFTFRGRGGLVEGFLLRQAGQELYFPRYEPEVAAAAGAEEPEPLPAAERTPASHWPRFRGPGGSGIGDGQGAPATWDGESRANVRWKTPIPGLALSSPVIWGDRVFVTTAVSEGGDETLRTGLYGDVDSVDDESVHTWKVYALDRASGRILWERTAGSSRPGAKRHLKSSHANPTPVTDGRRVAALFGSGGLSCYDLDGELLWQRDLGRLSSGWFFDPTYEWGFGSSPILHDGKLILQLDVHGGSRIVAWDAATGEELWRTERNEIPTWGTPGVLAGGEGGVDEIVTNGTTIRGYDAATGQELWRLGPNSEITVASPVVAGGVTYVTGGYPPVRPVYALRAGGRGDLSLPEGESASPHVVWSQSRGGTYIPTPIVYRGLLYILHNNGRLTAQDAATGDLVYRERVGRAESFSASPVAADGRLYFTTEEGRTYVVRAGRRFKVLETNELGEVVMATPAISDGLLVMRGKSHVWGLGEEVGEPPEEPAGRVR